MVAASIERQRTTSYLLGRRFSFSRGAENGRTDVTAIRLVQQWQRRSSDQAIALRSTESIGIDALGATTNPSGPDGRFFSWLGQAQYARRLNEADWQLALARRPPADHRAVAAVGADLTRWGSTRCAVTAKTGWSSTTAGMCRRRSGSRLGVSGFRGSPAGRMTVTSAWCRFFDAGGGWNEDTPQSGQDHDLWGGARHPLAAERQARLARRFRPCPCATSPIPKTKISRTGASISSCAPSSY